MNSNYSVLVTPRDGPPYQELLYRRVEALGVRVLYADGPTPSQTLNIFLAPAVLAWWRVRGCRLLHIHWIFQFSLPWARRKSWARLLMEWWFGLYLRTARILGYGIIWTAHDLLPHEQVFKDDGRARDLLVSKTSVVTTLSEATAIELRALGARHVRVIPAGSYAESYPITLTTEQARASFGFSDDDVVIALIGRLERYKGADILLQAVAQLPGSSKIKLLLAGTCPEEVYRKELMRLAEESAERVITKFEWLPDNDLARYFQATNISVFPFREITNSGSVLLAQSFGRPVVIADLPALCDIPSSGAMRFEVGGEQAVESLVATLQLAERLTESQYREMSNAALAWAAKNDWATAARQTADVYRDVLLEKANSDVN